MNIKALMVGLAILFLGVYANAADITGSCSNEATQCEISLNNMELCNNSAMTETYSAYFNGEYADWFSVLPNKVTLDPDECVQLKVYTVANCYADPGLYTANLIIQNGETLNIQCAVDLKQGHFVDIEVEPSPQNATQCEEKTYDLTVSNETIVPNQQIERIDLSISGIPEEWYVLEEERLLVEKGEPETVKLRVQAPCDADFGNYEFTARATLPNPNFYDEDKGEYVLGQGQSIQVILDFEDGETDACLETPSKATFKIINNGKLADNLKITLDGSDFASLSKELVALAPGEEETISINFAKTSEAPGTYDFRLDVDSLLYDYSTSKTFSAELRDCYNLEVEKLEGDDSVCVEDKPVYRFSLTNNRTKAVDLDVAIEGISADVDKPRLSIEPGETTEISAVLDVSSLAKEASVSKNNLAVELIIDSSGSMVEKIDGKTKMEIAKTAIINLANNINEIDLGLRVLGQGELCEDSELIVPVDNLNIAKITDKVSALEPAGKTPLAQALNASASDFPSEKQKAIILVSDGKETCEGNTAEAAKALAKEGIMVYAIGFDIDEEGEAQLREIAEETGGKYFDASNSEELLEVLQKISQELDIVPAKEGKRTFTVKLGSDYFTFEKDFSITVSDCYNATMVAPELNLCKGVDKTEVLTLVNLGSKDQEFEIGFSPDWVEGAQSIVVPANSEEVIPLTISTPSGSEETSYTVRAVSDTIELEQKKGINYLSSASCFGIDIIVLEAELNAETCKGQKQTVYVENRGVVEQKVTLGIDKAYAELVDKEIIVKAGEKKEVNFFVSPPFDLPETTFLTITAETDRGFRQTAQIKLIVHENQESFGLGEVDLRVKDLNISVVEGLDHDVEVVFGIYNDSNRTLEVFNATALDYNAIVQLEKRFIQAKRTVNARLLADLPEGVEGEITIPVSLETDEGTYTRDVEFTYTPLASGEPAEEEAGEPVSIGTGLFSISTISTGILAALIIIVLGLIVYSAYVAVQKEETEKPKAEAKAEKPKAKKKKTAKKGKAKKK